MVGGIWLWLYWWKLSSKSWRSLIGVRDLSQPVRRELPVCRVIVEDCKVLIWCEGVNDDPLLYGPLCKHDKFRFQVDETALGDFVHSS